MQPSPKLFRHVNRAMLTLWRLGLGRAVNALPDHGGRIMVLTTRGRKSGLARRTPLNYARVGDVVYGLAGFGAGSDWLANLRACPRAEVWLPDGRWEAEASEVDEHAERLLRLRQVLVESGFATPLFLGFNPREATEQTIEAACEGIVVVRLRLLTPIPASAADLAWLWPVVGGVLVAGALWKALRSPSHDRRPSAAPREE